MIRFVWSVLCLWATRNLPPIPDTPNPYLADGWDPAAARWLTDTLTGAQR